MQNFVSYSNNFKKNYYTNLFLCWLKKASKYRRCHHGDSECFLLSANEILSESENGIPELNIPPLNPLKVQRFELIQPDSILFQFNAVYTNLELSGFYTKLLKFEGFQRNSSTVTLRGFLPYSNLLGNYNVTGHLIGLPIEGYGNANVTMNNCDIYAKIKYKLLKLDDGREIIKGTKIKFSLKPRKFHSNYSNLFGGDEELGDTMNKLINDNWKLIFQELGDVISRPIGLIILKLINNVLEKFDHHDLFLD